MATFPMSALVTGFVNKDIEADTFEEACEKMNLFLQEADFGPLENIDWDPPKKEY